MGVKGRDSGRGAIAGASGQGGRVLCTSSDPRLAQPLPGQPFAAALGHPDDGKADPVDKTHLLPTEN